MQEFATHKAIAQRVDVRLQNCFLSKYRMAVRIMRLTAIILLAACLQLSAEGITQTVTISVKDAPLFTVLKAIEKQTDFVFFVNSKELKRAKNVSITANNLPLQQVLDMCFKDQPLTYAITGKWINVIPRIEKVGKEDKTGFMAPALQNKDINGVITDENGSPAQGVNVVIKGTGKGTSTNYKGEFQLKDVDENAYLVITSIGYNKVEVPVKDKAFLSLQLRVAVGNLDEMQVIFYGSTSRRFNTGNVSTIKASDIEKQPVQNPLLALQGRVTGIEITQLTGLPGGGVTAQIQGDNSIAQKSNPLIVIDGIPFLSELENTALELIVQRGSPLNYINPTDIESIDILKDADATAIYGSRAANGAILITTKKGKAGKTKISVNVQQGWGKVARFADMMNTRQYLDMRYEAFKNDGISAIPANNFDLTVWDTTRYTDWQKTLIGGTAQYTNIGASVSGGTEIMQYLIGGTYNRQSTAFPGDFDNKRGGLNFNINGNSSNKKFRVELSGNYMHDKNSLPGTDLTTLAVQLEPNAPALFNADGTLNWAPNASGASTWTNPLASTIATEYNNITKSLVSRINLSYEIVRGLKISSSFGYTNLQSKIFSPSRLERVRPENRPTQLRVSNASDRNSNSWIVEPQASYSSHISKGKLDALLGFSLQQNSTDVLSLQGSGYSSDLLMNTFTAANSFSVLLSSFSMSKFNALFARLNYIWDEKYILNFSARRDGSSKFGDANKLHNFGSAGLAWIFSNEKWLQKLNGILSFGKLRGSYGTSGNDQIGDFGHLSLYGIQNPQILYQGTIGLDPARIPNPHLQWEETRKLQGGIDLGFLKDKIIINVTYARNRSSNQLVSYTIPSTTGFKNIAQNMPATVQNTSWEFVFTSNNIRNKDFSWSSSFNLTIPRNKLVSFPGIELTSYANGRSGIIEGHPIGVIKVFHYAGVDPATGLYQIADHDGGVITSPKYPDDYNKFVNTATNFYGGLSNNISYKGFQLDFLFQFVRQLGPKHLYYYNGTREPGRFVAGASNQPVTVLERWKKPGDESSIARFTTGTSVVLWPASTTDAWYTWDASFIRLKNLSLSWQLPGGLIKNMKLQTARVFFQGQNLATITNYKGLDPETRSISTLPPLRMLTTGFQLVF